MKLLSMVLVSVFLSFGLASSAFAEPPNVGDYPSWAEEAMSAGLD